MPLRWIASPSEDLIREALSSVVPDLAGEEMRMRPVVKGDDPDFSNGSADLGSQAIVKYAWARPSAERLWREARVMCLLSELTLPVPRVLGVSSDPVLLVTQRVPGEWLWYPEASQLTGAPFEQTARDMGGFLARLHRPEVLGFVQKAGVELPDPEAQTTTAALRSRFGAFVDDERQRVVAGWCDWVDEVLDEPSERVLLHGDFAGHNLMWDRETGSVAVVYDFERASLGDPAFDFRYLPAQAASLELFTRIHAIYEGEAGRRVPVGRVMAWHVLTVLGDALWRSEARVELPLGGTPTLWVDELQARMTQAGIDWTSPAL